ncbi:hypothetical protein K6119_09940 [Paracrocinitomix mangrovi]|uniref:hypothetical protein n=1 Tax=Paracrocinitomix mangrovi TaxID=2862509 RepID=UPI001C8E13F2|nr:hypothetical protein [Paracrocinitomix mangrovi]UKN03811.1 hypothetical protein K6119_09940 [Paracrocinitomix mangrovi]
MKLILIFQVLCFLLITSCNSKEIESVNSVPITQEPFEDSITLNKDFVWNKIASWRDSTILTVSVTNGDKFSLGQFVNDSVCGYDRDSLPLQYKIDENSQGVYFEFYGEKSAIVGVPSISKFHIYKFEYGAFYGTSEPISPEHQPDNIDTMVMVPRDRYDPKTHCKKRYTTQ